MIHHEPKIMPRPVRQPLEDGNSHALNLVAWYDRRLRQGAALGELQALSPEELELLQQVHPVIRTMAVNLGLLPTKT